MDDIKIISQKAIYKANLFEVKKTEIQIDKKKKIYNDIYRKPVVSIFPLTDSYELYLISEFRYLHKKNMLGAIAGFIEDKETTLTAAKRELKEETGITAMQWEEIARIELAASVIKSTVHLFLAKGLEIGESNPEDDEDITLVKLPLEDAVRKVMSGEINMAVSIAGILMLDKLRKEKKL